MTTKAQKKYHIMAPRKPINSAAMAALIVAYHNLVPSNGSKGGRIIFTDDSLLLLGKLFYEAWGVMPKSNKLKAVWHMSDIQTVLRKYVTLENYHTAIRHYMNQEIA